MAKWCLALCRRVYIIFSRNFRAWVRFAQDCHDRIHTGLECVGTQTFTGPIAMLSAAALKVATSQIETTHGPDVVDNRLMIRATTCNIKTLLAEFCTEAFIWL